MAVPRRAATQPMGFDFTHHMRRLCDDMVHRVADLRHIDMDRVAVSFSQTRKAARHGMYASLTPLRFAGGKMHTFRRGRRWGVQRLYCPEGREMLYILSFYLPRFLELDFHEKLTTVVHELWHISPQFDGDLRRFAGRCYAHGSSREGYDAQVERLTAEWLDLNPPQEIHAFLKSNSRELSAQYGSIHGIKIRAPKLIPIE